MYKVEWVGPFRDISGYGNADRNYLISLIRNKEIELSIQAISFEQEKVHLSPNDEIIPYCRLSLDAPIKITHLTPDNYSGHFSLTKYNIGYTAWETSLIPSSWVAECNRMNEIWVPSKWNIEVFKNSGVTVPIYHIPHIVPEINYDSIAQPSFPGDDPQYFWFYSIFQWTARKNPQDLLIAYLTEFINHQDVVLALKTYRKNSSSAEFDIIKNDIINIKRDLNLPRYPKILLFNKLLNNEEMLQLHKRGNCYISATRGEAWGLTFSESMMLGNPTIGPDYGGSAEFMKHEDNSLLFKCKQTPVYGMNWMPNYNGTMLWADPDIMDIRKCMRWVYNNQDKARELGNKARKDLITNYSYEAIGNIILERIKAIYKEKRF